MNKKKLKRSLAVMRRAILNNDHSTLVIICNLLTRIKDLERDVSDLRTGQQISNYDYSDADDSTNSVTAEPPSGDEDNDCYGC